MPDPQSPVPPAGFWPWLVGIVTGLGGILALVNRLRKMHEDRLTAERQRIDDRFDAKIRPLVEDFQDEIRTFHRENVDRLNEIKLEQADMKVKVDDMWERRRQQREAP